MSAETAIDWKKLSAVNLNEISKTKNHPAIQENIPNILNCNPIGEFNMYHVDPNFHKLFSLAQITIRSLMESQSYLSGVIVAMGDKIKAAQQNEKSRQTEKEETEERLSRYKKKCSVLGKMMQVQQHMVSQNNNGEAHCQFCPKSFVSLEFLLNHMQRRHPDKLQEFNPTIMATGKKYGVVANEAVRNDLGEIRSKMCAHSNNLRNGQQETNMYEILCQLKSDILKKVDEKFTNEDMNSKFQQKIENLRSSFNLDLRDLSDNQNKILTQMEDLSTNKKESHIGELEPEPKEEVLRRLSEDYEAKIHQIEAHNSNVLRVERENWEKMRLQQEKQHENRVEELESIIVELRVQIKRMGSQLTGDGIKKVTTNVVNPPKSRSSSVKAVETVAHESTGSKSPSLPIPREDDYYKMLVRKKLKKRLEKIGINPESTGLVESDYIITMDRLQMKKRKMKNEISFFDCRQKVMVEMARRLNYSSNSSIISLG